MKNVMVLWADSKDFELHVPVEFVGKRNLALGLDNNFHLLFLYGCEKLSKQYLESLKSLGYVLHDASKVYEELDKKYSKLNCFSRYDKNCFLRWLVIDEYFPGEKVILYDGDIVFNEDPEVIKQKVLGKTFVLQGGPGNTFISDRGWFEIYRKCLDVFDCVGKFINEQEFISHLVDKKLLPQDDFEDALKDYVVFENPLWPRRGKNSEVFEYKKINGIDYFNDRKVLYWHMQTGFNFYLIRFILRQKFLKVFRNRLSFDASEPTFENRLINKLYNTFDKYHSRLFVYNYFFKKHDLSGVLNDKVWWQPGVFK